MRFNKKINLKKHFTEPGQNTHSQAHKQHMATFISWAESFQTNIKILTNICMFASVPCGVKHVQTLQ